MKEQMWPADWRPPTPALLENSQQVLQETPPEQTVSLLETSSEETSGVSVSARLNQISSLRTMLSAQSQTAVRSAAVKEIETFLERHDDLKDSELLHPKFKHDYEAAEKQAKESFQAWSAHADRSLLQEEAVAKETATKARALVRSGAATRRDNERLQLENERLQEKVARLSAKTKAHADALVDALVEAPTEATASAAAEVHTDVMAAGASPPDVKERPRPDVKENEDEDDNEGDDEGEDEDGDYSAAEWAAWKEDEDNEDEENDDVAEWEEDEDNEGEDDDSEEFEDEDRNL